VLNDSYDIKLLTDLKLVCGQMTANAKQALLAADVTALLRRAKEKYPKDGENTVKSLADMALRNLGV